MLSSVNCFFLNLLINKGNNKITECWSFYFLNHERKLFSEIRMSKEPSQLHNMVKQRYSGRRGYNPCWILRNKSWKPECVGSFNMDWRILYVISLEMLYTGADPKIGKNKIFWCIIVIFHTKYPKFFRASLRNWKKIWFFGVKSWFFTRNTLNTRRNIFKCAPPPNLKFWIRPWYIPLKRDI